MNRRMAIGITLVLVLPVILLAATQLGLRDGGSVSAGPENRPSAPVEIMDAGGVNGATVDSNGDLHVSVGNLDSLVAAINGQFGDPVQASVALEIPQNQLNQFDGIFDVPEGKRLIIDQVSGNIQTGDPGDSFAIRIRSTLGAVNSPHEVAEVFVPGTIFHENVSIYTDPGPTTVGAEAFRKGSSDPETVVVRIVGRLIDVP